MAGIISLLNDYLISNGKPPLGFLNFLLYFYGVEGLNDITSGSNPGCGTEGFPAVEGWDPVRLAIPASLNFNIGSYVSSQQVTGLGTLDFMKLGSIIDQVYVNRT